MKILSQTKGFVTNSSSANYWLDNIVRDYENPPVTTHFREDGKISNKTYHDFDDARIIIGTLFYHYDDKSVLEKETHYNTDEILTKEIFYNDQEEIKREIYYNNETGVKEEIVDHETGQTICLIGGTERILDPETGKTLCLTRGSQKITEIEISQNQNMAERKFEQDNLVKETAYTFSVWLCLSIIMILILVARGVNKTRKK